MNHFCTIITADYLPYAQQLFRSISECFSGDLTLHVMVSDNLENLNAYGKIEPASAMEFYSGEKVEGPMADALYEKYALNNMDAYRWSMKSVFIKYLLRQVDISKVIYLDSDIHFVGNGDFLFDLLSENRFLITPHWRCANEPEKDTVNFQLNFTEGIYNGGFIGASTAAVEILDFWTKCCLANCEINRENGFYVDQKYLDILTSRFEGIGIVRHKGCNLAGWNILDCPRSIDGQGNVKIDGVFEPIFIHFTPGTRKEILTGKDLILKPFFIGYNELLKEFSMGLIDLTKDKLVEEPVVVKDNKSLLEAIKSKVRLRTRIQAFIDG